MAQFKGSVLIEVVSHQVLVNGKVYKPSHSFQLGETMFMVSAGLWLRGGKINSCLEDGKKYRLTERSIKEENKAA